MVKNAIPCLLYRTHPFPLATFHFQSSCNTNPYEHLSNRKQDSGRSSMNLDGQRAIALEIGMVDRNSRRNSGNSSGTTISQFGDVPRIAEINQKLSWRTAWALRHAIQIFHDISSVSAHFRTYLWKDTAQYKSKKAALNLTFGLLVARPRW